MEREIIDKLFLELSQITGAKTSEELRLEHNMKILKDLLREAQCPDILHCDNGIITNTFNNDKSRCVWCVKREQAVKG